MRRQHILLALFLVMVLAPSAYSTGMFLPARNSRANTFNREPSQRAVLFYWHGGERLLLQVRYAGNASKFVWLVPTPSLPEVETGHDESPIFLAMSNSTAPAYKYWFDADKRLADMTQFDYPTRHHIPGRLTPEEAEVPVLKNQARPFDVEVLQIRDKGRLLSWLGHNGYSASSRQLSLLEEYIARGWVFTAIHVGPYVDNSPSEGWLPAIWLSFGTKEPVYPLRISSLNGGNTDLVLCLQSEQRFENPLLRTECSVDHKRERLTRFTARLSPEQMTRDIVFKPAGTETLPVKRVAPPFLQNLGMTSVLILACLNCPLLALPILLLVIFATRRRVGPGWRRVWISICFCNFVSGAAFAYVNLALIKNFIAAGIVSLVVIAAVVITIIVRACSSIRKPRRSQC